LLEFPESIKDLSDKKVFLVAATLRPETMYGQTNCFVLPGAKYGVFKMKGDEYFVMSDRAAKNRSYQELVEEHGKIDKVGEVTGDELVGLPLKAPLTSYERVYALPMSTISMKKGTGIVTSVPSDSPDDYETLKDL
jgi:leucyl-tRNA synthetase